MNEEDDNVVTIDTNSGHTVQYLKMDGICYPPLDNYAQHLRDIKNFRCRQEDTWVCGYPKSGNHWIWEVANMVLKGRAEYEANVLENYLIDFEELALFEKEETKRVLVSHLACKHLPTHIFENDSKIIYIIRNPKDVVVSSYNHLASIREEFYNMSFSEVLSLYMSGQVYYGDWYDHVLTWWERSKQDSNVLVVKYEDMKRDLMSIVQRVAKFFEKSITEETCRQMASLCSFENMKQNKKELHDKWREHCLTRSVYRKGEVGDWKNWFSEDESVAFDIKHQQCMKNTDMKVEFDLGISNKQALAPLRYSCQSKEAQRSNVTHCNILDSESHF